ncbi:MAG: tRNA (adenosine(37)-N6)-threonylcarbamoyltransferase complex dimerization subunit type 1 TsaB [Candidatus Buchananbacteria bacterium RIFCSPLOWO2_01_FULL_45_31]|uniref:tRNA (Adenosine(37)-N6)-threonylcarbamoyltransferase complex dimerization subunit type 1 TsaB n=1 Tax=Candidatus Buchananbacteria bacterium RIFCSPLOWO2_01_FULL_45_31 TaxID=1797545 RepID=A0A1G1YPY3_9BACT|nr:MAG: tRNA (adenosine(37)-N6)-threonylcarbamoyltransferase complex dimerization subunit type 1 TsaB [Candidatus Buchananbacteria bacterium RIFCSPLOWO2_01_FULL_45_31]
MLLLLHTADEKKVFIGLAEKGKLTAKKIFDAQYRQAEKLMPALDKFLGKQFDKLKGIAVVCGPGPFTALRIGIAVGNTLAWGLKIPVAGVKLDEFSGYDQLAAVGEKKIKTAKKGSIVEPFYGKEPSITLKKR